MLINFVLYANNRVNELIFIRPFNDYYYFKKHTKLVIEIYAFFLLQSNGNKKLNIFF